MSGGQGLDIKAFDALLDAVVEGVASAGEVERLNALLREDGGARARYIAYMEMHAALADPAGPLGAVEGGDDVEDRAAVMSEVVAGALAERRRHELEDAANRKLAAQQAEEAARRRRERPARPAVVAAGDAKPGALFWLGLAAAIGLVAVVVHLATPRGGVAPGPVVVDRGEGPVDADPGVPVFVARVSASVDARWGGGLAVGDRLAQGGVVELFEGVAEVAFEDGTVVLVEGPATFEPTGRGGLRLVEGRVSARASGSLGGFRVETGEAVVAGQSAEFGVEASGRHGTLADVFVGRVLVDTADASGRLELTAGTAARATAGGARPRIVAADSSRFYRGLQTYTAAPRVAGRGRYLRSLPADLSYQQYESDGAVVVAERCGVVWSGRWPVDEAVGRGPTPGQSVDVFLVHFDPVGSEPSVRDGSADREVELTFERPVLAVITRSQTLYETDAELGGPGTVYPSPRHPFAEGRGLEDYADAYELSPDGKTLRVRLRSGPRIDQVRVVVTAEH